MCCFILGEDFNKTMFLSKYLEETLILPWLIETGWTGLTDEQPLSIAKIQTTTTIELPVLILVNSLTGS